MPNFLNSSAKYIFFIIYKIKGKYFLHKTNIYFNFGYEICFCGSPNWEKLVMNNIIM